MHVGDNSGLRTASLAGSSGFWVFDSGRVPRASSRVTPAVSHVMTLYTYLTFQKIDSYNAVGPVGSTRVRHVDRHSSANQEQWANGLNYLPLVARKLLEVGLL